MSNTSSSSLSSDSRFRRSEAHTRRRDANISRRMSQQHLLDQAEEAEASFSQSSSQRNPEAHAAYRSLSAVSEEVAEEAQFTSLSAGPGGVVLPSDATVDFFASLEAYKLKPGDPPLTDAQSAEKHADVAKFVDQVAEVRSNPSLEHAVLKALDDQAMEGQADSPHGLWYQMASECHKSIRTMKLEISKHDAEEAAAGAAAAAAGGAYNAGEICTICQDRLPADAGLQTVTACRHAFCADCLDAWKDAGGHRCPNCNQGLDGRALAARPVGPHGFGVSANNIGALTPFAPGSLAGRNDDNDTPPSIYPSLGRTSAAELAHTMDLSDSGMESGYRYLHADDEPVYRGAVFRSAVGSEEDDPVFVSCGAGCGADEPSAKRVCA